LRKAILRKIFSTSENMKMAFLVVAAGVIFGSGVLAPAFADGPRASGWRHMAWDGSAP